MHAHPEFKLTPPTLVLNDFLPCTPPKIRSRHHGIAVKKKKRERNSASATVKTFFQSAAIPETQKFKTK